MNIVSTAAFCLPDVSVPHGGTGLEHLKACAALLMVAKVKVLILMGLNASIMFLVNK